MAVLEKIRKKSVLLFIIIIGALLAFILGDFINSGRSFFGPGDTVAKVNGVKVDYQSFQAKSKELSEQMKAREAQLPDDQKGQYDDDQIGTMAMQQALLEQLLQSEFDKMGIKVSSDLLSQVMLDPDFAGLVFQSMGMDQQTMMYLSQLGITDQRSFIESFDAKTRNRYPNVTPEMAEQFHQMWLAAEQNVENQLKSSTYMSILGGLFQPNNADALAYYADANDRATVRSVSVPTSSIADDEVKLTDADYQEYYDNHEGMFKIIDESRAVAYIKQNITPSAEDRANAVAKVRDLKAALTTQPGMTGAQKFSSQGFVSNTAKYTNKTLRSNIGLAQIPDSLMVEGYVAELGVMKPDVFSLAKILNISEGIDRVSFIAIPEQLIAEIDSLVPDKSITAIDSIMTIKARGNATQELSLIDVPANFPESYLDALTNGPLNTYFTVNDTVQDGASKMGFIIKDRDALTPVYEIGIVNYELVPSSKTAQSLAQKLNAFVANNAKAADFVANAEKEGYTVEYSTVDQNSYTIGRGETPRTKPLVKWAMDADKGDVSPVITVSAVGALQPTDYLIAAAVTDVYDDEIPVSSAAVKNAIEPAVRQAKKNKMLVERYAGKAKDINGYAKAMALTENDIFNGDLVYSAMMLGGEAQGAVAAAKDGALVGPVAGAGAVYVVQVDANKKADASKADLKNLKNELRNSPRPNFIPAINQNNLLNALIGDKSVKNNLLIFTEDINKK